MSPPPPSSVPIPRQDLTFQRLQDGSAVLVDAQARSYALNATGADVWELCAESHTVEQICEALLDRYEATPEVMQETVGALLEQLMELRLLSVSPPVSAPDFG